MTRLDVQRAGAWADEQEMAHPVRSHIDRDVGLRFTPVHELVAHPRAMRPSSKV